MKKYMIVVSFFIIYFILGSSIYKDYGACWDDIYQRDLGVKAYNYAAFGDSTYLSVINRFYGPAFQLMAYQAERTFHPGNIRNIYYMRHFMVFLVFYIGLIFFYAILSKRFGDWRLSLLGCVFMVLSPRLFGHTFYNPKDIPFLSFFVITVYGFMIFLEKMTLPRALFMTFMSAVAITMRILGLFIPAFVVIFTGLYILSGKKGRAFNAKAVFLIVTYIVFLIPLVVILWPILWEDPVKRFIEALYNLKALDWHSIPTLYFGNRVHPAKVPWHYTPVWMLLTIPVTYLALFFFGVFRSVKNFFSVSARGDKNLIFDMFFLAWFFLPLILPMLFHSPKFSSWRHSYFIYPALIIMAVSGVDLIWRKVNAISKNVMRALVTGVIALFVIFDLGSALAFMIRNHPYQDLYFNELVGGIKGAEGKFELDYWGISYREGLEYIAKTDNAPVLDVLAGNYSAKCNLFMLPETDSARFNLAVASSDPVTGKFTYNSGNALTPRDIKYYITDFYGTYEHLPFPVYYSVKVDGVSILDVYISG